jgi:hypothetical protein
MANFTEQDLKDAADDIALMAGFPIELRVVLMSHLMRMTPSLEALQWLTHTLVTCVPHWPGILEVRLLLCSRYDPADGIVPPNTH